MVGRRRYSKLEKEIEKLFVPELKLSVKCFAYPIGSYDNKFPRYYIQINHEIIWDFPKNYVEQSYNMYFVVHDIEFNNIMREYIDTSIDKLLDFKAVEIIRETNDNLMYDKNWWEVSMITTNKAHKDFVEILKSADRRIGKQKLSEYFKDTDINAVKRILHCRGVEF